MSTTAPTPPVHDGVPAFDADLFSDEAVVAPYQLYRRLRDVGPVAYLSRQQVYAVGRYDEVRGVLADDETFLSGQGVAFNGAINDLMRGATLTSDGAEHEHLRQVVAHRLTPRALREERSSIDAKAEALVNALLERDEVLDGVTDIAQAMPMSVVPDFIGFPDDSRDQLIGWAVAALDAFGPPSERHAVSFPKALELSAYIGGAVEQRRMAPGSLGHELLAAADRGEVPMSKCPMLMVDYFAPSLETTISALGSAIALFSQHPDQWDLLRENPDLAASAFNEAIRLESPLRAFTRIVARDTEIGGHPLPEGARIAVFFASANRDERKWDRPDEFDITRQNADHVALGYGAHGCAGQGLARLEITSVLTRLARSVARIEPVGEARPIVHPIIRSYTSVPVRLHKA
ncbi:MULTISPECIES: cytochrome P450 [Streptomyces]|uniref:Cytochrome P450 n=1 Tax=Streptomyces phaeolivaceus TaxID=2653200 RepID=A0A5P8KF93_9ACTN|nr:cytochrome P450 [Streptomyces phaeolivaceus]QFR01685.1 cytochrome P450 [Streptomyces phaeolivaceus]